MGNTVKINIPVTSTEHGEIIIAEFSEMNFHAFEQSDETLSLFIMEEFFDEKIFAEILHKIKSGYSKIIIPDFNWNEKWESDFLPVIIDSFVLIRAAFHSSVKEVRHEIIITPKMSFGTGHHATTYLMLQQMQYIDFNNKSVLDFGTGSGILSILANKMGSFAITAIDIDDWSIENSKENFYANNCDKITLLKKDSIDNLGKFDIVLANINLNTIISSVSSLKAVCHSKTKLLLSGFLSGDEKELQQVFKKNNFQYKEVTQKDGWICIYIEG